MTILLALLIFASGCLFGCIVMACFAVGAAGAVMSTTRSWSSPSETSADPENAPPERDETRRENPTELRLVAWSTRSSARRQSDSMNHVGDNRSD
jgi:hypothetical protein